MTRTRDDVLAAPLHFIDEIRPTLMLRMAAEQARELPHSVDLTTAAPRGFRIEVDPIGEPNRDDQALLTVLALTRQHRMPLRPAPVGAKVQRRPNGEHTTRLADEALERIVRSLARRQVAIERNPRVGVRLRQPTFEFRMQHLVHPTTGRAEFDLTIQIHPPAPVVAEKHGVLVHAAASGATTA